jgi:N6-adenosine-specific RNA methylase IME4
MVTADGVAECVNGTHTTVLQAARREHSRKPEEFYSLVA